MTIRRAGDVEEVRADAGGLHHQVAEVHRCLRAGENQSPRMPWATSRAIIERFDAVRSRLGVRYDTD